MDDSAATMAVHGGTASADGSGAHVLLLPFPGMQGHANPMLQLGHRLAYHGLRPTLVVSRDVLSTTTTSCTSFPFPVAAISDGFDVGGLASCPDTVEYSRRMEAAGSETLAALLDAEARAGRRVRVLVYDSHLPWARRVARHAGVAAAAFMTQMCAVDLIYGEVRAGRAALPVADGDALRGIRLAVELGPDERATVRGSAPVVPGVHGVRAQPVRRARARRRRARQLLPRSRANGGRLPGVDMARQDNRPNIAVVLPQRRSAAIQQDLWFEPLLKLCCAVHGVAEQAGALLCSACILRDRRQPRRGAARGAWERIVQFR